MQSELVSAQQWSPVVVHITVPLRYVSRPRQQSFGLTATHKLLLVLLKEKLIPYFFPLFSIYFLSFSSFNSTIFP